jgi:hypothetical protein
MTATVTPVHTAEALSQLLNEMTERFAAASVIPDFPVETLRIMSRSLWTLRSVQTRASRLAAEEAEANEMFVVVASYTVEVEL